MRLVGVSGILVWSVLLWMLLWADLSIANLVSGVAVGVGVLTFARLPRLTRGADIGRVSPWHLLRFTVTLVVLLVQSNLVLAWEIVTPRNRINSGIIAVPLRTDSEIAMLVVASVITLTPGTITIESTGSPPVLWVNVMHLHDLDRVRQQMLRIEELSVRAFGSQTARSQLAERLAP